MTIIPYLYGHELAYLQKGGVSLMFVSQIYIYICAYVKLLVYHWSDKFYIYLHSRASVYLHIVGVLLNYGGLFLYKNRKRGRIKTVTHTGRM